MSGTVSGLPKALRSEVGLDYCERAIAEAMHPSDECQDDFVEIGLALGVIRQRRLFEPFYSSFSEYSFQRWNCEPDQARALIQAAAVVERLEENRPQSEAPQSIGQLEVLSVLASAPTTLEEAWATVLERHGPEASQEQVRAVVAEMLPPDWTPESIEQSPAEAEAAPEWAERQLLAVFSQLETLKSAAREVLFLSCVHPSGGDEAPLRDVIEENDREVVLAYLAEAVALLEALENELKP